MARERHQEQRCAEEVLVQLGQGVPRGDSLVRRLASLHLLLPSLDFLINRKRLALLALILDGVLHEVDRREGSAGHGDHRDAERHRAGHLPVVGVACAGVRGTRRGKRRRRRRRG